VPSDDDDEEIVSIVPVGDFRRPNPDPVMAGRIVATDLGHSEVLVGPQWNGLEECIERFCASPSRKERIEDGGRRVGF
jgi:hypothetical protein